MNQVNVNIQLLESGLRELKHRGNKKAEAERPYQVKRAEYIYILPVKVAIQSP